MKSNRNCTRSIHIPEYLHVLRHTGRKVLHRPRAQYRVLIGGRLVRIVARRQYKAGLRLVHTRPRQIAVLQARALYVDDALRPDGHLQDHAHGGVQLHRTEQHHVEVLQQRMRVELVQKVHNGVRVQRGRADDHVFLALGAMRRVRAAQLLAFHPREGQLLELEVRAGDARVGWESVICGEILQDRKLSKTTGF